MESPYYAIARLAVQDAFAHSPAEWERIIRRYLSNPEAFGCAAEYAFRVAQNMDAHTPARAQTMRDIAVMLDHMATEPA